MHAEGGGRPQIAQISQIEWRGFEQEVAEEAERGLMAVSPFAPLPLVRGLYLPQRQRGGSPLV